MSIANATEAEVYEAYARCSNLANVLQEYVQGDISRLTIAETDDLIADGLVALQVLADAGTPSDDD